MMRLTKRLTEILTTHLIIALFAFALAGCATRTTLSEQSAYQQYPVLEQLNTQLSQGNMQELDIYSPHHFNLATKLYQDALRLAKTDNAKAVGVAEKGLAELDAARENKTLATYHLSEVLAARKKSLAVNADKMTPDSFRQAEKDLLRLTGLIEKDRLDEAKAGRADVERQYISAELAALKGNIVDQARDAIAAAKRDKLDRKAPKTMALAQEEFQLALKILDADRTDTQRAQSHAENALWNTRRAQYIGDMMTNFETSDFNEEDKILWYQEQVSNIVSPVMTELPFNQSNREMVASLNTKLSGILSENAAAIALLAKDRDTALDKLEQEKLSARDSADTLSAEKERFMTERQQAEQQDQAIKSKFAIVQSLFSEQEANVYRQLDNVLIRAHGFNFPSGKSEIQGENYALVNKIIKAVGEFPGASIVVSGHTDDRGSPESNQVLSEQRADQVASILAEIGRIPAPKISVKGYGEEQPVASNDTPEGRASNRRVEILIINQTLTANKG